MVKKGVKIWILSTVTFASLVHVIDAAIAFISNNQAQLIKIFPLIGEYLTRIPTDLYLYMSAAITAAVWGLTCVVAFDSPSESLLNRKLANVQVQKEVERQVMEEEGDFFDSMGQGMQESKREFGQINDLGLDLRAEVKDLQKTNVTFEETKPELAGLKEQVGKLEEKMILPLLCKACGKPLSADFSTCPHCGSETNIKQEAVVCEPNFDTRRVNKIVKEEQTKGCQYWFGYLSQKENEEPIPQECLECKEAVECMLSQMYSSTVAAEINRWY